MLQIIKIISLLFSFFTLNCFGFELAITYQPSPSEKLGLVSSYQLKYQPINAIDKNRWFFLGSCPRGQGVIFADSTKIVGNPVYLTIFAIGSNQISNPAALVKFDTNNTFYPIRSVNHL